MGIRAGVFVPRKVFISHSVKDMEIAEQLERALTDKTTQVILAVKNLKPGEYILEKVKSMIQGCNAFIAILTENSLRSFNVAMEVGMALALNKKHIFLVEEGKQQPTLLSGKEVIFFTPPTLDQNIIYQVKRSIEH